MNRLLLLLIIPLSLCLIQRGSAENKAEHTNPFALRAKTAFNVIQSGGYEQAIPFYRKAAEDAKAAGDTPYSILFLMNLGACQAGAFKFQAALQTLTEARELAEKMRDRKRITVLNVNMSSLFAQMGNLSEATKLAEDAVRYPDDLKEVPRASLFIQVGIMRARMGNLNRAEDAFATAIDLAVRAAGRSKQDPAREPGAPDAAAWAWDSLANARSEAGRIDQADFAATEGFRLRKTFRLSGIDNSYLNLGTVRAAQGDSRSALRLVEEAEKALALPGSVTPAWRIYLERGRVELGTGELEAALKDLRRSRELARDWRVEQVANDVNRTSLEGSLGKELYQYLVEAGNRLYFANQDEALVRETFEAVEENRAASLRALLPQQNDWRNKLPARYYAVLAKLKAAETAAMVDGDRGTSADVPHLKSDLDRMESDAGAATPQKSSSAVNQAIQSLDGNSALFSFQLGDSESWLWTLTENGMTLHRIGPRKLLAEKIRAFQVAVRENKSNRSAIGTDLYASLFGSVEPEVLSREHWTLLLDRELFELPFPALSSSKERFLIEDHSFQIASGALMLKSGAKAVEPIYRFLGVGDPIYNLADARAEHHTIDAWPSLLIRSGYGKGPAFARLRGSAREIEVSAQTWNAPLNVLLKGRDASPDSFWTATRENPEIIHIATHILEGKEESLNGWIALSLGGSGELQYITPKDILSRAISARLVVLSGCSSGRADAPTATGLMGLTRAWIAAGAGAVIATQWPTVDDDGEFFRGFYSNLRQNKHGDPAEALRQASLAVLRTQGWRNNPSFWAGYFLMSND